MWLTDAAIAFFTGLFIGGIFLAILGNAMGRPRQVLHRVRVKKHLKVINGGRRNGPT